MSRSEECDGPQQRRHASPSTRVVDAGDKLVTARADGAERERADLFDGIDRYANVRGNRLERTGRSGAVRRLRLGGEQVARCREPLAELGLRPANQLHTGRQATDERAAFGEPDGERRDELLALRMHEHYLDVMLEQHLPQSETLVHPRSAERYGRQLDVGQVLGTRR